MADGTRSHQVYRKPNTPTSTSQWRPNKSTPSRSWTSSAPRRQTAHNHIKSTANPHTPTDTFTTAPSIILQFASQFLTPLSDVHTSSATNNIYSKNSNTSPTLSLPSTLTPKLKSTHNHCPLAIEKTRRKPSLPFFFPTSAPHHTDFNAS